jgi:hypothetical protein
MTTFIGARFSHVNLQNTRGLSEKEVMGILENFKLYCPKFKKFNR